MSINHAKQTHEQSEPRPAWLTNLETEAAAPVLVGEVTRWCRTIARRIDEAQEHWPGRMAEHGEILDQALRRDPHLARRIEALREREAVVGEQLRDLSKQLALLSDRAESGGNDQPFSAAQELRVQVLAWCVAVEAQDGEIQSLFLESHYRERGVVD